VKVERIMGCWVVPSVAAEFWRVSLEHVMDGIRAGTIPSKTEDGFLFVEAVPNSPSLGEVACSTPMRRTYVEVPLDELPALASVNFGGDDEDEDEGDEDVYDVEDDGDESDFDEESPVLADWRVRRQQSGTLRRAPARR
jgi:hypothetical protein